MEEQLRSSKNSSEDCKIDIKVENVELKKQDSIISASSP